MTSSKLVRLLWKAYISCTDWGLVPGLRKECVYLWFWNRNHSQVTWFLLINNEYGQVKRQGPSYSVVFVFYKLLLQRISGSFPGAYKTCEKYFYSGRFSWLSQMSGLDLCVERSRHKWCYPMGKNRPKYMKTHAEVRTSISVTARKALYTGKHTLIMIQKSKYLTRKAYAN